MESEGPNDGEGESTVSLVRAMRQKTARAELLPEDRGEAPKGRQSGEAPPATRGDERPGNDRLMQLIPRLGATDDHRHPSIESFRDLRIAFNALDLRRLTRKLGGEAVKLGKIITFEPMNPRDRRVVHMALAKFEGVITKSDGEGDGRRVQIIPVRR